MRACGIDPHESGSPADEWVGLASNLAALRALASVGIQRGHLALHARAVTVAAGATGELVQSAAQMMVEARDVTLTGAKKALGSLRGTSRSPRRRSSRGGGGGG